MPLGSAAAHTTCVGLPVEGVAFAASTMGGRSAESIGAFAYIQAGGLFSIDLRTGRVTGPLERTARLVLPTLVRIP